MKRHSARNAKPLRAGVYGHTAKLLPLALLALSNSAHAQSALKREPKVGDHRSYAMRATIVAVDGVEIQFSGKTEERTASVDKGLITTAVENTVSVDVLGVVRFGRPVSSIRVERLDGGLVTPAKIDETLLFATPRVERLLAYFAPTAPVQIGAAWWHTETKDEEQKAPPFSSYMKLDGEEKLGSRDVWRVSIDANEVDDEHPTHLRAMVWLDKADGSLVRGQWAIDGFTYNATSPPGRARLELTRVD